MSFPCGHRANRAYSLCGQKDPFCILCPSWALLCPLFMTSAGPESRRLCGASVNSAWSLWPTAPALPLWDQTIRGHWSVSPGRVDRTGQGGTCLRKNSSTPSFLHNFSWSPPICSRTKGNDFFCQIAWNGQPAQLHAATDLIFFTVFSSLLLKPAVIMGIVLFTSRQKLLDVRSGCSLNSVMEWNWKS